MIVASTALAIWPIISVCLFKFLGGRRGLIYSVMIGFLFLPPNYFLFLPVVPKYGSGTAIAAGLALSYLFFVTIGMLSWGILPEDHTFSEGS